MLPTALRSRPTRISAPGWRCARFNCLGPSPRPRSRQAGRPSPRWRNRASPRAPDGASQSSA
eukprot:14036806-Alexandrium_andersonii.AAC.1